MSLSLFLPEASPADEVEFVCFYSSFVCNRSQKLKPGRFDYFAYFMFTLYTCTETLAVNTCEMYSPKAAAAAAAFISSIIIVADDCFCSQLFSL